MSEGREFDPHTGHSFLSTLSKQFYGRQRGFDRKKILFDYETDALPTALTRQSYQHLLIGKSSFSLENYGHIGNDIR